ncbi:3-hydroxyisobutyrate dehydrogenase [Prauserella marina]|uniref:3-hydroxyisobutyrate dehydrogenase n=1 Tax=Prauserella marina TaxID=530584 RepID=A0A222VS05_9PSEU|nr:3-hydroxyisobutyrate dehydrogenase [Prauserella marina]ASR36688.1 3-hydroxyisobutyrate dehydrogenase [Prauserella marina]PWV74114.1 3-hydroxyisobutyrate dehydrogenase [Prauserella marina]SDD63379.1 3-hydroxyisobutyrate dehydrogenase [Prauserella marina]
MSIAFLGLGNMGGPMAANLVKAGQKVTGYDPVSEARVTAAGHGVSVADSAVTAIAGADVVITMLPSGQHVLECYREIVPATEPGTLFLDCSTIEVADAHAAAGLAAARGHLALDAPVSGGVVGATAATLTFMAGGPSEAFIAAEPYLKNMGKKVVHCGETGAGQAAKICNNMILGVSMIAVSEAFVLGRRLGLTDQALFDVASTASGQCWALTTNCPVPGPVPGSPANREYAGGFASGLMLKDLHLAQAAARAEGVRTELGKHAEELYSEFVAQDGPGRDFSAIITSLTGDGTA